MVSPGSTAPSVRSCPRLGRSWAGGAGRVSGSTGSGAPYVPGPACSPTPGPGVSRPCSPMSAALRFGPPGVSTSARFQVYRVEGPGPGKVPGATGHQLPEADRPRRARGDHDAGQDPDRKSLRHPWPTSTAPAPPTAPRQAINGRLEHLRGIALRLRNLTSYTIRSLIHAGRLKDHLTAST